MPHTVARAPGNLPAEISSFVGRSEELAGLTRLLHDARLVTVTGIGGVGKTRTALRAAELAGAEFGDGVWLVELSGLQDPRLLPQAVADTLGLADQSLRRQMEVLAEFLADRSVLLVLDTCEHLLDACALLAEVLLPAAPGLRILATSRRPLGLSGERVLVVEPLPVPPEDRDDSEGTPGRDGRDGQDTPGRDGQGGLDGRDGQGGRDGQDTPGRDGRDGQGGRDGQDSVLLFADRARAADPAFDLTGATRAAVARICRRLDGIPLAIELAAVWLRTLTAEELAERLDHRFDLLTGGDRTLVRHGTLRAAIGWSHELLTPPERLLWARLSVFPHGFDAVSATRVCADERLPSAWIPGLLEELVETSILLRDGPRDLSGAGRYRLPKPIREYGADWLEELGEQERIRRLHRDRFLELAHRYEAEWRGPRELDWGELMRGELPNVRAALEFCADRPAEWVDGLELFGSLLLFWLPCGHVREGRLYAERLLALDPPGSPALTKALWAAARLAVVQGDLDACELLLARCLRQAEGHRDLTALAVTDLTGAAVAMIRRDFDTSVRLLESATGRHLRNGEPGEVTMAHFLHAVVLVLRGRPDQAIAVSERCRESALLHLDGWGLSFADYARALAELRLGDARAAVSYGRAALRFKARLGDSVGCALVLDVLALAAVFDGEPGRGARLLGLGQKVWRTCGLASAGSADLQRTRDLCEALARDMLGEPDYWQEFAAGHALGLESGLAYAAGENP